MNSLNTDKSEQNFDAFTGVYISSVLLVLLSLFIFYFFYLFIKRKRKLMILRKKAKAEEATAAAQSDQEQHSAEAERRLLLATTATNINEVGTNDDPLVQSRKNSELIDYLISKHYQSIDELNSRKNSLLAASNQSKQYQNQLLSSKVSLILLSSLLSQDCSMSIANSIENESGGSNNLSILLNSLLNTNTLDKETANRLSDTIAKYYANRRKVIGSLTSAKTTGIYRSKSICALSSKDFNRNKLKSGFDQNAGAQDTTSGLNNSMHRNHRRVYSEKGTRPYKKSNFVVVATSNLLSVPGSNSQVSTVASGDDDCTKFKRQWTSEKRSSAGVSPRGGTGVSTQSSFNDIKNSVSNNSSFVKLNSRTSSIDSKNQNKPPSPKPTTIYELYKSKKLHVSSLFDNDDNED